MLRHVAYVMPCCVMLWDVMPLNGILCSEVEESDRIWHVQCGERTHVHYMHIHACMFACMYVCMHACMYV